MKPEFAIYDKSESLFESVASDIVTFGLLMLCIWFSGGDRFWQFFCGVMFMLYLSSNFSLISLRKRKLYFKTKAEVLAWANSLPDDSKVGAGETAEVAG